MKKKTIIKTLGVISLGGLTIYLFSKNRQQSGIIRNQNLIIEGYKKQTWRDAYHIGKLETKLNNLINNQQKI